MSYLNLGWNWIRLAITHQWKIQVVQLPSSLPAPQPAIASKGQHNEFLKREFTVLSRIPLPSFVSQPQNLDGLSSFKDEDQTQLETKTKRTHELHLDDLKTGSVNYSLKLWINQPDPTLRA